MMRKQPVREPDAELVRETTGYAVLLDDIKQRIRTSQVRAALSVNRELILLYWDIGRSIAERQQAEGWGKSVVDRLARDLQAGFPGITGFSPSNVWRMRSFYVAWAPSILAQAARELTDVPNLAQPMREIEAPDVLTGIPWFHNVVLVEKLKDPTERLWYAQKTIENGWSRSVLVHQIESNLYHRQGGAISNFHATLPPTQSDLARELLKDPYTFDFLSLGEAAQERELEQGLIDHIQHFLLELGMGFAFVGRQYHLEVGGEDFYLDLLFYHLHLRCYVVIDLKVEKFKPEFAGKMNFYLAAADDLLRHGDDQPSIGLIICKEKNRVIAEYSLRDMRKPVAVAEYMLTQQLPDQLAGRLPSPLDLEQAVRDSSG